LEPVHYLKVIRRRWWVIVLSVLVAMAAAWFTTEATTRASASSSANAGYGVKIVLWNPGAPVVGPGYPLPTADALAQIVQLRAVVEIAAETLNYQGNLDRLSSRVAAAVDPTRGFLTITGTGKDPASAEAVAEAFSQALIVHLQRLQTAQIDQQQQLLQDQLGALIRRDADPIVIATVRNRLAQLSINRTTPIPLTEFERQPAVPIADLTEPAAPADEGESEFKLPESRRTRVILAGLLGLLAGLGLALVLERFDTRVRSSRQAEEAFGLPVLAEVPAIARGRRKHVVTATHPHSRAADAFRLIEAGTDRWTSANGNGHANGSGGPRPSGAKTILVTSPEARDGKTTVAANLAVAYAQAGSRVLVVSCDLRRPAIHEAFDVPEQPGLTDALGTVNGHQASAAQLDLAPYLEPCSVVRVAILPSGESTERPNELLGSAAMQGLGDRLKRVTDVVILDCAPLVVAGDVVPLLPLADGVVLVARAGKTRQEVAASTATLLERLGSVKTGVVLNDAREFSIPLAKRRMYRPTRRMRKAAQKNPQPRAVETWAPAPTVPVRREEPLPVVEEARTPPVEERPGVEEPHAPPVEEAPAPEAQAPGAERAATPVVEDAPHRPVLDEPPSIELDRDVEIPDVADAGDPGGDGGPTPSRDLGSGPATADSPSGVQLQVLEPVPEPASTRPAPGVPLEALQLELTELLAELDDFRIDLLDGSTIDLASDPDRPANGSTDGSTHEASDGG
jgi:capsular exopolysaccharide synthesis family protein